MEVLSFPNFKHVLFAHKDLLNEIRDCYNKVWMYETGLPIFDELCEVHQIPNYIDQFMYKCAYDIFNVSAGSDKPEKVLVRDTIGYTNFVNANEIYPNNSMSNTQVFYLYISQTAQLCAMLLDPVRDYAIVGKYSVKDYKQPGSPYFSFPIFKFEDAYAFRIVGMDFNEEDHKKFFNEFISKLYDHIVEVLESATGEVNDQSAIRFLSASDQISSKYELASKLTNYLPLMVFDANKYAKNTLKKVSDAVREYMSKDLA